MSAAVSNSTNAHRVFARKLAGIVARARAASSFWSAENADETVATLDALVAEASAAKRALETWPR